MVYFDYVSVFQNLEHGHGACWYVLDEEDQSGLTLARNVPIEQAHLSWALDHPTRRDCLGQSNKSNKSHPEGGHVNKRK